ncbi:MAG TPA: hypothetical protein VFG19_04865 [Geobacteraceae bacterium]|nr:hypothetical protein [Geobacteraceae bacterium]
MKKSILGLVVIAWALLSIIQPTVWAKPASPAVFTATVSSINKHELYVDGIRFFIDRYVQIVLYQDNGREVSLQSLVSAGRIEEATLYVTGNRVIKIVVLQMVQ